MSCTVRGLAWAERSGLAWAEGSGAFNTLPCLITTIINRPSLHMGVCVCVGHVCVCVGHVCGCMCVWGGHVWGCGLATSACCGDEESILFVPFLLPRLPSRVRGKGCTWETKRFMYLLFPRPSSLPRCPPTPLGSSSPR